MFRALCAFLLLASPALADFEVLSDYTIDASNVPPRGDSYIQVRNNAVLTIQDSPDGTVPLIGRINLHDTSTLVLRGGWLLSSVTVFGDSRLELLGGKVDGIIQGTGDAYLLIDGARIGRSMHFVDGVQHYEVRSFDLLASPAGVGAGPEDTVELYSSSPTVDSYNNGAGYRVGDFFSDWDDNANNIIMGVGNWTMYDTQGRPDGDTNLDGVVDLTDLNNVRNAFGHDYRWGGDSTEELPGDTLPFDGVVDLSDLNRVRNNFGASSNPVPEPSSIALMVVALGGCYYLQRLKRR